MNTDVLTNLLPVITGGVIAVAGGALAPLISHHLQSKKERRRERIDKFEELLSLLSQLDEWLGNERLRIVYGETRERSLTPLHRAEALCAIYFPQFRSSFSDLTKAVMQYEVWMAQAAQKRIRNEIQSLNDGFMDVYQPYRHNWTQLVSALTDYASEPGNLV